MNKLFIGFSKQIPRPKGPFLLIDDEVPMIPLAQVFEPKRHSLDPLRRISARQARDLAEVLYTAVPQGAATLTVRNGRRALAPALLTAKRFDLIKAGDEEMLAMVDDLLFLPELRAVLCATNPVFALKPHTVLLARLNRAELGDFAALVVGLILINQFKGQLVIPDFGFYGRDTHISLIRQDRLIAGLNYLDELKPKAPDLRYAVLSIKDKTAQGALYEDADTLARLSGKEPGTRGFRDQIGTAIS